MKVAAGVPGWTEITDADVYTEAGVSGTLRSRPALNRLLADAKAGRISHVICTKMDRLARNLKLLLEPWDLLESYGCSVVIIEFGIDTSTAVGRLIRNVLGSIAEFVRDTIVARTSAGPREAVRQGAVYRRHVLGYHCIPADKKNSQLARVEIDEAGAGLVRRIFTSVAQGTSLHALARQLNAEGMPTLRGGGMWRVGTLQKIIHNPLYSGQAAYGRWTHVKTPRANQRRHAGGQDHLHQAPQ